MAAEQNSKSIPGEEKKEPAVNIGNASNPAPDDDSLSLSPGNQWLNEKAEKYLRESASIEDVPDAQDQREMDEALKEEE